jgi:hypothetical protein
MAEFDWSIQIMAAGTTSAVFVPNQPPPTPPSPPAGKYPTLTAQNNDVVSWGNQTKLVLQPWLAQMQGQTLVPMTPLPTSGSGSTLAGYICDPIPPNNSSDPQYVVTASSGTIFYCCLQHSGNTITVLNEPGTQNPVGGQINVVKQF